ncbi:MAG: alpha/beta hydrolase [Brachymonas sp.]|nr:alpha/beta hydrolase [Brachymonas sp.]
MAQHVCALGMALVAPSYRLAPANRLPAAYEDALSCLSFVQIHAANWGIHTQRLILSGHSAGGHLAALVALRARPPHVAACMPISAIVDLHHPAPSAGSLEERVYTLLLDEPSQDAPLSPIHWTTGNSIAFVLTVGEQDSPRVLAGNRRMQALLSLQTAPSSLHVQPGQSHFDTHTSLHNASHPWYKQLRHLAVQSPQ